MKLPEISSAMLIVTHACNLACRYCFVNKKPQFMELDTAWRAAEMLAENARGEGAVPGINFFGGEPTLMWDKIIVPLTERIRGAGQPFELSMTSNGILLDDGKIEFMREKGIGLLFSVDGDRATQDYNRPFRDGRGSFDALAEKIPKIAAAFPGVTFRMTAIPETCSYLFENIMFAEGSGFESFFVIPDNFRSWSAEARETLAGELVRYADYYIGCYREGKRPIEFSTFEEALGDIRRINAAKGRRDLIKCRAEGKCGLGAGRFASIHPDGSVYACQEMSSNAGEDSPFWIGNIFSGIREDRRRALMGLYCGEKLRGDGCESCPYDRICDGGCVANNFLVTGDVNTMPEVQCWWRRTVLDQAVRVMQTLGNERNQGFKAHWEARA